MSTYEELQGHWVNIPDLHVCLPAPRLICAVYDAVQQEPSPLSPAHHFDSLSAPILHALLTYCYAVGVYASEEIEFATQHDPALRYLCANHTPKWETIREFRRRNIKPLQSSLTALCCRLNPAQSSYSMHRLAAERLSRAIQSDSHALDF